MTINVGVLFFFVSEYILLVIFVLGVHAFMSVIWTKLQADSLLTSFIRLSCALLMVWLRKAHSVHLMATISFQSMTRYPYVCC